MAKLFGNPTIGAAATAENLTAAQQAQVLNALTQADLAGLAAFAQDAAKQGVDEAGLQAAFPKLSPLTPAQVRFVMRLLAANGGLFWP